MRHYRREAIETSVASSHSSDTTAVEPSSSSGAPRSIPLLPIRLPASAQIDFRSSPLCSCSFHPQQRSSQPLSSPLQRTGAYRHQFASFPHTASPDLPCSNGWEFYQTRPFRCPVGFPTVCRRQILSLSPTKHPCAELKPPYSVHQSGSGVGADTDPDPETPAVRCCASLIQQCNSTLTVQWILLISAHPCRKHKKCSTPDVQ